MTEKDRILNKLRAQKRFEEQRKKAEELGAEIMNGGGPGYWAVHPVTGERYWKRTHEIRYEDVEIRMPLFNDPPMYSLKRTQAMTLREEAISRGRLGNGGS